MHAPKNTRKNRWLRLDPSIDSSLSSHGVLLVKRSVVLAWVALALTLFVAHVTLAGDPRAWAPTASMLLGVGLQGLAVGVLVLRWRQSPGEAGTQWLLLAVAVLYQA